PTATTAAPAASGEVAVEGPAPDATATQAPEPATAAPAPEPEAEAEPVIYNRKSAIDALVAAGVDQAAAKKMVAGALKGLPKGKEGEAARNEALAALVGSTSQQAGLENALIDMLEALGPDHAYDREIVQAVINADPVLSQRVDEALGLYDTLFSSD